MFSILRFTNIGLAGLVILTAMWGLAVTLAYLGEPLHIAIERLTISCCLLMVASTHLYLGVRKRPHLLLPIYVFSYALVVLIGWIVVRGVVKSPEIDITNMVGMVTLTLACVLPVLIGRRLGARGDA